MGSIIVITSGKGGVGKTTTTANLGTALALEGQRVVLVDTDIGLRNLDVALGLDDCVVYDIIDVVQQTCTLSQGLIQDNQLENLMFLSASQTKDKSDLTPEQMGELAKALAKDFAYVLIDCPAGMEEGFRNAVAAADQGILVVTPDFPSVRDADRVIGYLESQGIQEIRLLVNRFRQDLASAGHLLSLEEIQDMLGYDILAVVPEDDQSVVAASQGVPVAHQAQAKSGQAYRNAAKRLLGQEVPFLSLKEPTGFLYRLKKAFQK